MHLLASTHAAMAGLMAEAIEEHVRAHLVNPQRYPDALDDNAAGRTSRSHSHLLEVRDDNAANGLIFTQKGTQP